MKTPRLDEIINSLETLKSREEISRQGEDTLVELKKVKEFLTKALSPPTIEGKK